MAVILTASRETSTPTEPLPPSPQKLWTSLLSALSPATVPQIQAATLKLTGRIRATNQALNSRIQKQTLKKKLLFGFPSTFYCRRRHLQGFLQSQSPSRLETRVLRITQNSVFFQPATGAHRHWTMTR